jgi:serine/threonine-protein kinase RsbT
MDMKQIRIAVKNDAGIAWSVMEARKVAKAMEFEEQDFQMIAAAVSELAYNIVKYAGHGEILMGQVTAGNRVGLEVIAHDRGPGIENVQEAMSDHFSSGGTLGLGLPGVKRMMDEFDLSSEPGKGTTVTIRKWR